jgi:hypothetical protein
MNSRPCRSSYESASFREITRRQVTKGSQEMCQLTASDWQYATHLFLGQVQDSVVVMISLEIGLTAV